MSNDYLEFKEHLEHAYDSYTGKNPDKFTIRDQAEYYRKQELKKINKKANEVIAKLNDYMQTCKKAAERKQRWADNATKIINSPAGSYAKSETRDLVKYQRGQKWDTPKETADVNRRDTEYWKRQYELALAIKKEILADPTKASKGTRIGRLGIPESAVSHSNLEHGFSQKDKAEYYQKPGVEKVYGKASSVNKDEVRKKMLDFINQFNVNEQAIKNLYKTDASPGAIIDKIDKKSGKHSKWVASRVLSNELTKRYDRRREVVKNMLEYARSVSGTTSGVFTSDELSTINKISNALYSPTVAFTDGTARKWMAKLQADLTKKSSAGMPSNINHSSLSHATGYDYSKRQNTNLNKKVANERFSTGIKSKVDEINRKGTALQSSIVSTVTEMNNMHGQVNNLIKDVNAYNENVRGIRANGTDPNRQYVSVSIMPTNVAQGFITYKPKMVLIDSDPGTYKEV